MNRHPFGSASIAALCVYAAVLANTAPQSINPWYTAGEMLVPVLLGFLTAGATARDSGRRWRWWAYTGVVLAVTMGVILAMAVMNTLPKVDRAIGEQPARPSSTLWTPDEAAGWRLLDSATARTRRGEVTARLQAGMASDDEVVYGEYRGQDGGATFMGINTEPGSELRIELTRSTSASVTNALGGYGVDNRETVDSGDADVPMACGMSQAGRMRGATVCAWADVSVVGTIIWFAPGLGIDEIAVLSREFRRDVSRFSD